MRSAHCRSFFMTKAQLVTDLMNILGPGVDVDATGLTTWINDAYMYMVSEIQSVIPDYFAKPAFISSQNGIEEYQLASDYDRMILVNMSIGGQWRRLQPLPNINAIPVYQNPSSQGFSNGDPRYYLLGALIGIVPIPLETTPNNIKYWYVYTPVELSNDNDVPAFPAKYHHIIKLGASANYLDRDADHGNAGNTWKRFQERVEQMVETLSQMQVDEPKSVEITGNYDLYADNEYYV